MQPELQPVAEVAALLIASDYDGTLAPIVADPAAAHPDPEAIAALRDLSGLPGTYVAVISGRARADLEDLLGPVPGAVLIGGHGGEWNDAETTEEAAALESRLQEVAAEFPGALIEPKPTGAAFHYRQVNDEDAADAARLAIEAASEMATRVVHGKRVVEFSTTHADKGSALQRLRDEIAPDLTVFIGDDATDEDGFDALGPTDVGIKVGPGPSAARWSVADQSDVAPLLAELAGLRRAAVDR